jgi:hypothetical protein
VVLHLRPPRHQVSSDLLQRWALHRRHYPRVDARAGRSTRQYCRDVERIRVSRRAATFFPLAASYRFCGDQGDQAGSKWSSARTEARESFVGKAAGDERVFIPGEGSGWQMRAAPTPCRTPRAVSAVTGPLHYDRCGNSQEHFFYRFTQLSLSSRRRTDHSI